MKQVFDLLAADLAEQAMVDVLSPFFRDRRDYEAALCMAPWLHALCTRGGNLYGALVELEAELDAMGLGHELASRRTIGRSLDLPKSDGQMSDELARQVKIAELERQITGILVKIANKAIKKFKWKSSDLFLTIDGRVLGWYGKGSNRIDLSAIIHRLSEAGRWSSPKFRNKNKSKVPLNRGTLRGHEWVHLTLHHASLSLSLPLTLPFRDAALSDVIDHMMQVVEQLHVTPQAMLFDKEFGGTHALVERVRRTADPLGMWVVFPEDRIQAIERRVERHWHNYSTTYVESHPETLHFVTTETAADSSEARHGRGHYTVYIYTLDELRPDLDAEFKPSIVTTSEAEGVSMVGIAFYSSQNVTLDNVSWFAGIYARRWACETLFACHAMFFGRSQSGNLVLRSFIYSVGFLMISLHNVQVAMEMGKRRRRRYDAHHSHRRFTARIRGHVKRRIILAAGS